MTKQPPRRPSKETVDIGDTVIVKDVGFRGNTIIANNPVVGLEDTYLLYARHADSFEVRLPYDKAEIVKLTGNEYLLGEHATPLLRRGK